MSTVTRPGSMNEANERDPFNNSSYGTLVDAPYKEVKLPILDVHEFNDRIIRGYEEGTAECGLPADLTLARSLIPAGTATLYDGDVIVDQSQPVQARHSGNFDAIFADGHAKAVRATESGALVYAPRLPPVRRRRGFSVLLHRSGRSIRRRSG